MAVGAADDIAGAITWKPVLAVVAAVAAVEDPDSFGWRTLEALAGAVPFDHASYNEVDSGGQHAYYCTYPRDLDPGDADVEAFPRLIAQNPILQYHEATGDGSAHRISDFMTSEELHGLELYQRVYAALGTEYQVAVGLATKRPLVIALALNRGDRDFTDDEVAVLNVLRPYLIQGYRNTQALAALAGIEGALAEVGRSVVLPGADGVEARAPGWAREVLQRHFGPPSAGDIPDVVRHWVADERQRLFANGQPRIHRPLASVAGGRQLVVRFVPGAGGRSDVLVLDEREPGREASELQRLGLTPREAEILQLVMRGESTHGVARRLGVTLGTCNKHLQHIYRKLGVTSRTSAIAAASDAIFAGE